MDYTVSRLVLFLALLIVVRGYAQETSHEKVVDSVSLPGYAQETYALYQPDSETKDGPTRLLLIFDPAGRGRLAVETFIPVARANNYLLVCSNDIKNGPYDQNLALTERLLSHLISKFSLDASKIITTGFSGGARLAVSVAVLSGNIRGVVGCGAGFSGNVSTLPALNDQFAYAGVVGDLDMNFREMHKVKSWFNSIRTANELYVFEGGHQWPPADALVRAFDWLRLQEMRSGILPVNATLAQAIFLRGYQDAKKKEEQGDLPGAEEEYERLLRNFPDQAGVDSIRKMSQTLHKLKKYVKAIKDREKSYVMEDSLTSGYANRFYSDISKPEQDVNYRWWQHQVHKLKNTYVTHKNEYLQKMGKRLYSVMQAMTVTSFENQVEAREKSKAIYSANILLLLDGQEPYYEYFVSKGFAELYMADLSLDHLEQALIKGLKHPEMVKQEPVFKRFAKNPRFISILESF